MDWKMSDNGDWTATKGDIHFFVFLAPVGWEWVVFDNAANNGMGECLGSSYGRSQNLGTMEFFATAEGAKRNVERVQMLVEASEAWAARIAKINPK